MGQYWSVLGGTESVEGSTVRCLVVLGKYGAVLVGSWWYWVSMEQNWLMNDGNVEGGSG